MLQTKRCLGLTEPTSFAQFHFLPFSLQSFGMYVVPPSVFNILEYHIEHNVRSAGGDFQFTTALETLRRNEGLHGYLVDGERFDLGKPERYFAALTAFQIGGKSPRR